MEKIPKFKRMFSPEERKEEFLKTIPKLEDLIPKIICEPEQEVRDDALVRALFNIDDFIESLTTSCCTFPPIKELNMRERTGKILKTFEKPDKGLIPLIGETIISLMQIQGDVLEMNLRYGGDSIFIFKNGQRMIECFNYALKLYDKSVKTKITPKKKTKAIKKKTLYTDNPGQTGETVYCVNIDLGWRNRRGFKITSFHNGVLTKPNQTFTISSLWGKPGQTKMWKENLLFEHLVEETKLIELGTLSEPGVVKLSKKGKDWLSRMRLKYTW